MTDQEKLDQLRRRFPHISGFGADIISAASQQTHEVVPMGCGTYETVDVGILPVGPWIQIIQLLSGWLVQIMSGCTPPQPAPTPAEKVQMWATDPRPLHRMYIRSNIRRTWRDNGGLLRDRVGMATDRRLLALRGATGLKIVQGAITENKALHALLRSWN